MFQHLYSIHLMYFFCLFLNKFFLKNIIIILSLYCLCDSLPAIAQPTPLQSMVKQAIEYHQQGHFELAIRHWQVALGHDNLEIHQYLEMMIQQAKAYQALGLSQQALTILLEAESLASKLQTSERPHRSAIIQAKLFLIISDVSLAIRQDRQARHYVDKSLKALPPDAPIQIRAAVFNQLGNVLTVEAHYTQAVQVYARCQELADQANDAVLGGRALINMAQAYFKDRQWETSVNVLLSAQQYFESLDNGYAKAFGLLSVGEFAQHYQWVHLQQTAYQALTVALHLAKELKNNRLISYAYGFLGQLYETTQHYKEALRLTRQAIFYAKLDATSFFTQQDQASEILYRWQWQLGRLFKAQHQTDQAISAYQSAVKGLQAIRQEIALGYRTNEQSFRERVGPVYFGLADLLLQRAAKRGHQNRLKKISDLKEALDTIERFKTAELQDYFQDECVTSFPSKMTLLEKGIAPHTAVVYPILLPDRTEILLGLSNNIQQFSIPLKANRLKDEVNEFRFELETSEATYFLPYAKRLYHWLIAPLKDSLTAQGVETLIIVPDGVLRTIPLAALHDGKQFLISTYAIVTIPRLVLTETKSNHRNHRKILLSGLSTSIAGYPALSNVVDEITGISKLYKRQNTTQLLNQDFTIAQFSNALKTNIYSILHIASHGQFDSDPQKTFLLAYDDKLTMNQLEALIRLSERRQEPMELLTLSACQTAVGNDQAALGLAGIALKAGARSALASLWFIDDKATTRLMKTFYQQLQKGLSKAKALQTAQMDLLKHYRYRHPAYWAPFLLIGNWK